MPSSVRGPSELQADPEPSSRPLANMWPEAFEKADEKACKKDADKKDDVMYKKMFTCLVRLKGEQKVVLIPIIVTVVSPTPPSDKIGVKSIQRGAGDILPMKAMKMDWIPYIPLKDRQSRVDKLKAYPWLQPEKVLYLLKSHEGTAPGSGS